VATVLLAYGYSLHPVYTMGFSAHVGLNSGIELATLSYGVLLAALLSHAHRLNALETIRHGVTSDLHAAEIRLVRVAHDKNHQLAMLAHELRNPLTPLHNGIEIVRRMSGNNPTLARTADMMARQIVHLVRLADNLMGADGTESPLRVVGEPAGASAEATPESARLSESTGAEPPSQEPGSPMPGYRAGYGLCDVWPKLGKNNFVNRHLHARDT
jgi:hypothetical protein